MSNFFAKLATTAIIALSLLAIGAAPPLLPRPYWTLPVKTGGSPALALSPDGQLLAMLVACEHDRDMMLRIWDIGSGKALLETPYIGGRSSATRLAFLPGAKAVVSTVGRSADNPPPRNWLVDVKVFELPSGKVRNAFTLPPAQGRVSALSPDGKTLLVSGEGFVFSLYDLGTGLETNRAADPDPVPLTDVASPKSAAHWENQVSCLEFSPDGKFVAVGTRGGWVSMWNLAKRTRLWQKRPSTWEVNSLSFSPDGKMLASAGGLSLHRVSDGQGGRVVTGLGGASWGFFLEDSQTVLQSKGVNRVSLLSWNHVTKRVRGASWLYTGNDEQKKKALQGFLIYRAAISADRTVVVLQRANKSIEIWKLHDLWPE